MVKAESNICSSLNKLFALPSDIRIEWLLLHCKDGVSGYLWKIWNKEIQIYKAEIQVVFANKFILHVYFLEVKFVPHELVMCTAWRVFNFFFELPRCDVYFISRNCVLRDATICTSWRGPCTSEYDQVYCADSRCVLSIFSNDLLL